MDVFSFVGLPVGHKLKMTEIYNLDSSNLQRLCRVCLGIDAVRPMFTEETNWYHSVILLNNKAPVFGPDPKLHICTVCGWLLKKCIWFHRHCRNSQNILNQAVGQARDSKVNIHINRPLHNFVQSKTETNHLVSESDHHFDSKDSFDDVNFHQHYGDGLASDRDDDLPLVMLSKADDGTKENHRVKKKRKKSKSNEKKQNGTEIKQENDQEQPSADGDGKKSKKQLREGFTSRMVQETAEYVVIKLSREQVLEEMRERSQSEKYRRALYKCALCVQGFNFEDVLAAHMEKHTQENGSFDCNMCSQYCRSAVSLRGHIKSHTTRYKCKICGEVRRGRQHLLEHHALAHGARAHLYSCQHCQFTTDKRTVIQRHARAHRAPERRACAACGRLCRSAEALRVHAARHDKARALRCGECGRGFLYPSLLQKHTQSVHQLAEYYCVECDVRFKSAENLRLHFKKAKRHRDSSSYTYACAHCSERFVSGAALGAHCSAAHGQPRRHACALCRRPYSSRDSLRAHTRRAHKDAAGIGALVTDGAGGI